jgi:biopolymer transport protein ExbD
VARKSSLESLEQISEINLTPLMDLTFILLITFIITFPLIEQGIPLKLPRSDGVELDQDLARTVSIRPDGTLHLDDVKISQEQLAREMNSLGQAGADVMVYVRADESIRYAEVVRVLRLIRAARLTRLALVTRAEDGSE